MSDNKIGDEGAKALATNETLTSLNVNGNQIEDELFEIVTARIEKNAKKSEAEQNLVFLISFLDANEKHKFKDSAFNLVPYLQKQWV